jgi:site-specific recombinase XerD
VFNDVTKKHNAYDYRIQGIAKCCVPTLFQIQGFDMASIRYIRNRKRWQIRWHVMVKQGPQVGHVVSGSKTFRRQEAAVEFKAQIERKEDYWAAGIDCSPELISTAEHRWYAHNRQYTEATRDLYKSVVSKFLQSLPKKATTIADITPVHIRNYLSELLKGDRKARTCNTNLEAIRSFCNFLADHYEIANPGKQVRAYKEEPPDRRFLTDEEYEAIVKTASGELLDHILFISHTGLRATEFCNLRWDDVSPDGKSITIVGKGRKRRTIPLNSVCRDILAHRKSHKSNAIFLSKNQKPLNRIKLYNSFRQITRKLKINRFGPHALRHYFATKLLLTGERMVNVSKVLGHSSIALTEKIYIHILPEHLTDITEALV